MRTQILVKSLLARTVAFIIIASFVVAVGPGSLYALRPSTTENSQLTDQLSNELEAQKEKSPKAVKRIGILTGGGPASGHNEVIYSVIEEAQKQGIEVVAVWEGWKGLVDDKLAEQSRPLTLKELESERHKGGTVLRTSRENPYSKASIEKGAPTKLWASIQKLGLDALITCGGDDTNSVSYQLQKEHPEFMVIGLPKTMDNDIALPEAEAVTYGFNSFVQAATPALMAGKIDAKATKRVLVVEIFGRNAGHVAVHVGAKVEATRTLIPEEKDLDLEQLVKDVAQYYKDNKYAVVLVSEGVKIDKNYRNNAAILEKAFVKDARAKMAFEGIKDVDAFGHPKLEDAGLIVATILSSNGLSISRAGKIDYLFRSADASIQDRTMCYLLGQQAVKALAQGNNNQILYVHDDQVKSIPLSEKLGGRNFDYQGADKKEYFKANQALLPKSLDNGGSAQDSVVSSQPQLNFANTQAVKNALGGILEINTWGVRVIDEARLRNELIDKLVYDATFNTDPAIVKLCRELIRSAAEAQGAVLGSVYELYRHKASDPRRYTIPAINIRGMAYNTSRAVFASAVDNNVGVMLFEIAKSEMGYSNQRPAELTTSVLAAAIKEGYKHTVYMQGDHFQVAAKDFQENPEKAIEGVKKLIREAIEAGFYQVDLDMSTLVDWSLPTVDEQQKNNYTNTAFLTAYVRDLERELGLDKAGIVVNLGGEIGEIGMGLDKGQQQNSTIEDLRAFMKGYNAELKRLSVEKDYELQPITKLAIQTGTKHGGVRGAKGEIVKAKVSFNTIAELSKVAREEYGLAGVVQHGASTLPAEYFTVFAGNEMPQGLSIDESLLNETNKQVLSVNPTAEVHLATAYQDTVLDHQQFPQSLRAQIKEHILVKFPVKEGQDPEKVFIDNRKNAWAPFKVQVWNLSGGIQDAMRESLKNQFDTVFNNLGVKNSQAYVAELTWGPKLASFAEAIPEINYKLSADVMKVNNEGTRVIPVLINHNALLKSSPDGIMALGKIIEQLGHGNIKFVLHIARDGIRPQDVDRVIEQTFDTINKINGGYTVLNRGMFAAVVVGTNPGVIAKEVQYKVGSAVYEVIGPENYVLQFKGVIRVVLDRANRGQLSLMAKALKLGIEVIPTNGQLPKEELKKLDTLFSQDQNGNFHVQAANVVAAVENAAAEYAKQVEAEVRV